MVSVKALWANSAAGLQSQLRDHLMKPLFVPRSVAVVQILDTFKRSGKQPRDMRSGRPPLSSMRRWLSDIP